MQQGLCVGEEEGVCVGLFVGFTLGLFVGVMEGEFDGFLVGLFVGFGFFPPQAVMVKIKATANVKVIKSFNMGFFI